MIKAKMTPRFKELANKAGFTSCTANMANMLENYAVLIIDECVDICKNADMYRRPASEYAILVKKFERLNESDYVR